MAESTGYAAEMLDPDCEAMDAVPRRVPVAQLRPALERCRATEVTLGAGSRVVVMLDRGGVGQALVTQLERVGVAVLAIDDAPDAATLLQRLAAFAAAGPVQGVYWLPALDAEGDFTGLAPESFREALRLRVKLLHATMRALYDQVAAPGSFLVAATRLGGLHGYEAVGPFAPLGGAVCGFVKAFKRERPQALVKCVDFERDRDPAAVVELLLAETQRDSGIVEVGHHEGLRWTVGLSEAPLDAQPGAPLALAPAGERPVFVVTGAAGSIVAAIVADLAAAWPGTFYLLDRVAEPAADDPDLQRFRVDREGLKRELFERRKARGERVTPAQVERELAGLERAVAAQAAITAVRAAGGEVRYRRLDLLDAGAVAQVIDEVRREHGRIDVLLHAAGVEISHFLPDKEPAEFDLVFDVKAEGWFNLLRAARGLPLGTTVIFSSIAGRFGNGGQTDYSAANDLLCKTSASLPRLWPGTRAVSIDWTAWGGLGMAARGSIPS
ncbi:MAG: SDR family NAD(P)-dependent oxidoreductase [Proteobacteria bacterium]|nr:SDR family NAD(P)-dependent oxidoreductase [Pseudomonadota bacterium]